MKIQSQLTKSVNERHRKREGERERGGGGGVTGAVNMLEYNPFNKNPES